MHQLADNSNREIPNSEFRPPNSSSLPNSDLRIPNLPSISPSFRFRRKGISIIEVMTAVVVAMIGVFGTLVLIPFAVKQAQSGLDLDDARNMAVNSRATFEAMGFASPDRFVTGVANETSGSGPTATQNFTIPSPRSLFVDPVWVHQNSNLPAPSPLDSNVGPTVSADIWNNYGFLGDSLLATDPDSAKAAMRLRASNGGATPTTYPFFGQVFPALPAALRIQRVSLADGDVSDTSSVVLGLPLINRLFQSSDALSFSKFDTDDGDLAGQPFQIFDRDAAGNILSRQSTGGRLSQAMFIIPGDGQQGGVFRRVTLVFADRDVTMYSDPGGNRPGNDGDVFAPDTNVNPRSLMLSAMVTTRGALPGGLPSGFQGGEIVICPVAWGGGGDPMPNQNFVDIVGTPEAPGVRRDDWVMMINQLPANYPVGGVGLGDRQQIQFYRVANIDEGQGDPGDVVDGRNLPSLTLDGPAFDFGPDGTTVYPGNIPPAASRIQTYIVHLRDVVNVFEDTISL